MKPRQEPRRTRVAAQSFTAYRRVEPAFPFAWHYHAEIELTWIEAGAGSRVVGDQIEAYGPGDLVLLGSGLPHAWSSEGQGRRIGANRAVVIQFPSKLFADEQSVEFLAIHDLLKRANRGLFFPAKVADRVCAALNAVVDARGLAAWCGLARLLDELAREENVRMLASAGYAPSTGQGAQRRFERVQAFIETHLVNESLYLGDAARAANLTPAAFSRFFQRMSGVSFVDHVNELRIGKAARLLAEEDRPIAEIAFACGFGNLANFNRRFREYKKMSPREFRGHYA